MAQAAGLAIGMTMARRNWLVAGTLGAVLVAAALYFAWPQPTFGTGRAQVLPVDPNPLVAITQQGEKSFSIEVADDIDERTQGLMFRQDMADNHGMLFVFETTQPVGFWMKNTPMALDLLFIGQDGRIRAIRQGEPQSEALITPGEPVRYVLEFKAGTSERAGIREGDRISHPVINQARGPANPE